MKQTISFAKMHGIGNDFVLIDNRKQQIKITQDLIVFLADRHKGVGFDQLLLIDNSKIPQCDAAYRFFNPDGSQAEQCGNGQRCISFYLNNLDPAQTEFCLSGLSGLMYSKVLANAEVKVNMGSVQSIKKLKIEQQELIEVNFGNPHLILQLDDVDACNLVELSNQYIKNYPKGINFEIAQIVSPSEIKLRVLERGTGETLACGSGACAAVAALQNTGQLDNKVKVILPGGTLVVEYNEQEKTLYLTGPAVHIYSGEITL